MLLAGAAFGQAPTLEALTPARNAATAPRTSPVSASFSQPLANSAATLSGLRVFSQQAGGLKGGSRSVSGNTLTLVPKAPFMPGETVFGTFTTAVQSSSGQPLARPQVFQFTTATTPSPGTFYNGAEIPVSSWPQSVAVGDVDGDGDLDLVTAGYYDCSLIVSFNLGKGTFSNGPTSFLDSFCAGASRPRHLVLADLDGDGDLDLLSGNEAGSTISVRFNNGKGVFSGTQELTVTYELKNLVVGDIDGDGDLDIVTANGYNGQTVNVFRNGGTGIFSAATGYLLDKEGARSLALGDIDNDGDLDLLVTITGSTLVRVRANDGYGNFVTALPSVPVQGFGGSSQGNPNGIVLGDLDSDGDLDLVVQSAGAASVRLNQGNGTFSSKQDIPLPDGSILALGDVEGDGDLDLLALNTTNSYPLFNTVSVRLNDGAGTFTGGQEVNVASGAIDLALADIDGDGDLDLLTPNGGYFGNGSSTVSVRLNQAALPPTLSSISATTGAPTNNVTLTGTNFAGATAVTFNGVPVSSFIVISATQLIVTLPPSVTSGPVTVTTPGGTSNKVFFAAPPFIVGFSPARNAVAAPRYTPVSVRFGQALTNSAATLSGLWVFSQQAGGRSTGWVNVNGSTLSLVPGAQFKPGETVFATVTTAVESDGGNLTSPQVFQFMAATAPASGVFNNSAPVSVGAGPTSPVLGDIDGDGDLDLLVATASSTVSVRRNTGTGTYTGAQEVPLGGPARQIVLGDIDGDGDLDLLAVLQTGGVRLLRNEGGGAFTSAAATPISSGQGVALGDLDADGDLDLVVTNATISTYDYFSGATTNTTGTQILLNTGTGTFTSGLAVQTGPGINPIPVLADTDGDGDLDLLLTNYNARSALLFYNSGTGYFFGPATIAAGGGGFVDALAVGDIDKDGDLDLLTASYTSSRVSVRRNTDNYFFTGTEEVDLESRGPLTLALGDVDGDGDLDLITTNLNTRTIGVRLNDGTGAFSGRQEVPLSMQAPNGLALGDVDEDGDLDIVTPHTANNLVSVLLNQNQLRTPENPAGTVAGLNYQYYEGVFTRLPAFDALPVLRSGTTPYFDLASVQPRDINYAVRFTGYLQVPTPGQYSFFIYSDDGTQLFIGSTLVVDNDGQHNDTQERSGAIGLKAGTHALTLTYFQSGGNASLGVLYQGPDGVRRLLPAASLVRVAAPANSLTAATVTAPLQLYPNPSTGRFTVHYVASKAQAATLSVSDGMGRQLQQQSVTLHAGANDLPVTVADQTQGLYQVVLRPAQDQPQVQRVVIEP